MTPDEQWAAWAQLKEADYKVLAGAFGQAKHVAYLEAAIKRLVEEKKKLYGKGLLVTQAAAAFDAIKSGDVTSTTIAAYKKNMVAAIDATLESDIKPNMVKQLLTNVTANAEQLGLKALVNLERSIHDLMDLASLGGHMPCLKSQETIAAQMEAFDLSALLSSAQVDRLDGCVEGSKKVLGKLRIGAQCSPVLTHVHASLFGLAQTAPGECGADAMQQLVQGFDKVQAMMKKLDNSCNDIGLPFGDVSAAFEQFKAKYSIAGFARPAFNDKLAKLKEP